MIHLVSITKTALLPLALAAVALGQVQGQTNEALELLEVKTALQASGTRITDLETEAQRAKEQMNALTENAASANGDAQQSREAYERISLQMEGLGVAALDSSNAVLQQRLLTALSDLRVLEEQKRNLADALMALSEAALAAAKSPSGSATDDAKKALETGLDAAQKALAKLQSSEEEPVSGGNLQNATIVSLKDDLGIAVFNVGSRHGVHAGMPLMVYRQDKPVARAMVVDVRNVVCGAVIQELVSKDDPVKVGDTGRVQAENS